MNLPKTTFKFKFIIPLICIGSKSHMRILKEFIQLGNIKSVYKKVQWSIFRWLDVLRFWIIQKWQTSKKSHKHLTILLYIIRLSIILISISHGFLAIVSPLLLLYIYSINTYNIFFHSLSHIWSANPRSLKDLDILPYVVESTVTSKIKLLEKWTDMIV